MGTHTHTINKKEREESNVCSSAHAMHGEGVHAAGGSAVVRTADAMAERREAASLLRRCECVIDAFVCATVEATEQRNAHPMHTHVRPPTHAHSERGREMMKTQRCASAPKKKRRKKERESEQWGRTVGVLGKHAHALTRDPHRPHHSKRKMGEKKSKNPSARERGGAGGSGGGKRRSCRGENHRLDTRARAPTATAHTQRQHTNNNKKRRTQVEDSKEKPKRSERERTDDRSWSGTLTTATHTRKHADSCFFHCAAPVAHRRRGGAQDRDSRFAAAATSSACRAIRARNLSV